MVSDNLSLTDLQGINDEVERRKLSETHFNSDIIL